MIVKLCMLCCLLLVLPSALHAEVCAPDVPRPRQYPPYLRLPTTIYGSIPKELESVYFEKGVAVLSEAAEKIVSLQAALLRSAPSDHAMVVGRASTDEVQDEDAAMSLSLQRATAVRARLVELGVPDGRLEASASGVPNILNFKHTEAAQRAARRVDVLVPSCQM